MYNDARKHTVSFPSKKAAVCGMILLVFVVVAMRRTVKFHGGGAFPFIRCRMDR